MCKSVTSLSTFSFQVLLSLPLCMALSSFKVIHYSPISSSFLKTCPHLRTYFFVPLLLYLLPPAMHPLISHHISIQSFSFLPYVMPVHFPFITTTSHYHVTYSNIHMHHKPFLTTTRKHLWQ